MDKGHKQQKFKKIILTTLAIIILIGALGGIGYFLLYPNISIIKVKASEFDIKRATHNITLQLFVKISPPNFTDTEHEITELSQLEYISPEELARVTNEGKVLSRLEELNTVLSVDSADIKGAVQEGTDAYAMMEGPWHFPLSVAPGEKGNSIIIGHRFAEVPPSTNTFYNLDKIEVGDKIHISQKTGEYSFTVVETKVVDKNDRSVLLPTSDYRITLITCHPLWTSDQRLVIVGILDKIYRNI